MENKLEKVEASAAGILIGTSGFKYKHWFGTFYPQNLPGKKCLEYYGSKFPTLEASSTFHNMPEPKVMYRWRDSVPEGFIFAIRGPREVTHDRHLIGCGPTMSNFMRRVAILGDKLGPVTFQLQESEPFDPRALEAFASSLPTGFKYSVEFRSEPWYNEACYEILHKYKIASVIVGHSNKGIHTVSTTDWSHIRLSGHNPDYKQNTYSEDALRNWRGIIHDAKRPAYVYFNNEFKAFAASNATRLMDIMGLSWTPTCTSSGTYDGIAPQQISPNVSAPSVDDRATGPQDLVQDVLRDRKQLKRLKDRDLWSGDPAKDLTRNYPDSTSW